MKDQETVYNIMTSVRQESRGYYEEKKSRFHVVCRQITNEDEARNFLESVKKEYPDARHHCYAWTFYDENNQLHERHSDDGEPGGTAGLPIFNVIKHKELSNVAVVVARYFGGTLLGAGGLVRAYTKAASDALDNAECVTIRDMEEFILEIEYTYLGRVRSRLLSGNITIKHIDHREKVSIRILIAKQDEEAVHALMDECTAGTGTMTWSKSLTGYFDAKGAYIR